MALLTRELRASYAFVERNFNLSKRYWGWEVAFLVYSVAGALAVTLIGLDQDNARLILSLMIGATFWNYLSVVFSVVAEQISWERWEGTLEYTMMAPVRRVSQLFGSTVFAVLWGLLHTSVVLIVLVLFFGIDLSRADFLTAGVLMAVGSLSIIGIGMIAATLPLIWVERGDQMVFVLQSLLLLISGVYYSVTILPEWMQVIAAFSPATYILDGIRLGLIDGAPVTSIGFSHLLPLVVMAVVFIPLGAWIFARAEAYAKRTGKLKRVG
ncbi:MAG TPA: ABC transporter permease [Candidatus Limnocylindrales bacterium]|nr:ABC transporter permease [Candidatus Limnocylindrales bacterium]